MYGKKQVRREAKERNRQKMVYLNQEARLRGLTNLEKLLGPNQEARLRGLTNLEKLLGPKKRK